MSKGRKKEKHGASRQALKAGRVKANLKAIFEAIVGGQRVGFTDGDGISGFDDAQAGGRLLRSANGQKTGQIDM